MYRDEQDMNSRNMHVCIIKLSPPANLQEIVQIYSFLWGGKGSNNSKIISTVYSVSAFFF